MLHAFLSAHRADLIERCKGKVSRRRAPHISVPEPGNGISLFIEQLITTLQVPATRKLQRMHVQGQAPPEISLAAAQNGRELFQHGFTIEQVVHGYGDLCQAVTELAFERGESIQVEEFKTLNLCLDYAIAGAVAGYASGHDILISEQGDAVAQRATGFLAHELRNHIYTASLAVTSMKTGNVGLAGATSAVLDRSLIALRSLVDRTLSDVRVAAGPPTPQHLMSVAHLITEITGTAALEAHARECTLVASEVDATMAVQADRDLLSAAVGNLLQNAFKFTHRGTEVTLTAYEKADRVRIEVRDCCGGLPPGIPRICSSPSSKAARTEPGLGWVWQSVVAVSRPTTARSRPTICPERAAYSSSICRALRCPRRLAQYTHQASHRSRDPCRTLKWAGLFAGFGVVQIPFLTSPRNEQRS